MSGKLGANATWENRPKWLRDDYCVDHTSFTNRKHYLRSRKYYIKRLRAIGSWTDHEKIKAIEKECKRRRAAGEDVVVDHIVPLVSDIVCGLECHWNLEIITDRENAIKGNKYWPDCPNEINGIPDQRDFFMEGQQHLLLV